MRISDWSSDVCSSDLGLSVKIIAEFEAGHPLGAVVWTDRRDYSQSAAQRADCAFLFDINVLSALEHGYQTGWLIFRQMLTAGAPGGKASEVPPQPAYYAREKPIAEIGRASCRERVCQYV